MKALTVSELKRGANPNKSPLPREGTDRRKIYDLLMADRGRVVKIPADDFGGRSKIFNHISELRLWYRMDIRLFHSRGPLMTACLVGEEIGDKYVDYAAAARRQGDIGEEKKDD